MNIPKGTLGTLSQCVHVCGDGCVCGCRCSRKEDIDMTFFFEAAFSILIKC